MLPLGRTGARTLRSGVFGAWRGVVVEGGRNEGLKSVFARAVGAVGIMEGHSRGLHSSRVVEMNPVGIGMGVAIGALSLRYVVSAYEKWDATRPKGPVATASKYYKGPFEAEMSRSEAAKILGIRESAPPDKIRERHRKLLILNHPDTGGSTYVATKINEAKDKLLKGN